jgi:RNA polymerase sigma-70 factor, ECF subfamily
MSEPITARPLDRPDAALAQSTSAGNARHAPVALSDDTRLAVSIRELLHDGQAEAAREGFEGLVAAHQRRALRIAYQYLRNAAEADEAVQDAFVKVFTHIDTYREAWPFEVWFTRILTNGCLDRRKASARRDRWTAPVDPAAYPHEAKPSGQRRAVEDPEQRVLSRERRARLAAAVDTLEGRQRHVFMLCHYGDCTPREVSAVMGLSESTVRVHLFRASRKLRALLGGRS